MSKRIFVHMETSGVYIGSIAVAVFILAACSALETRSPEPTLPPAADAADACPQLRETEQAPQRYYTRRNPLPQTAENLQRGRLLYHREAKPIPCANCHGEQGDGKGPGGRDLVPAPRNFTCAATMSLLTDGQLYWVIENGAGPFHLPSEQGAQTIERPGRRTRFTAMQAHKEYLDDIEIWQLIMYLRSFQAGH